jgi:hypothetical protein
MAEERQEEFDALSMSDEDVLNMTPEQFAAAQQKPAEEEQKEEQEEEQDKEEEQEVEKTDDEEEADEDENSEAQGRTDIYEPQAVATEDEEDEEGTESEQIAESEEVNGINYKAEYERLFSPLKAAKREIQVKNVDDARRLMQMGVDYNIKMQALKPQLRIMRALDKNGLLDEDKINFLIDLDKKNPEAIKKFLKEKEIDPMDLDLDEESSYKPNSYAPTESEQALQDVLDDIQHTPSFKRTIDELGNKWDEESKKLLGQKPELIRIINGQIENGIYDQVMGIVESERMLGRLEGLNDLMAYKTVGDALQAQGAFKHLSKESKPERKASQDPKLKARKRAASPTKRAATTKPSAQDFNPLSMSDEEFEKMGASSFG